MKETVQHHKQSKSATLYASGWSKFGVEQFRMGLEVELDMEPEIQKPTLRNDDPLSSTGKIALAHLKEFPDYYTRLLKMETEAMSFGPKDRAAWKKSMTRNLASRINAACEPS